MADLGLAQLMILSWARYETYVCVNIGLYVQMDMHTSQSAGADQIRAWRVQYQRINQAGQSVRLQREG